MIKRFVKRILRSRLVCRIALLFIWTLPFNLQVRLKSLMNMPERARGNFPYDPSVYPEGVTLFGYLKAQMGLGQGARLIARAIEQSGLPHAFINVSAGNPSAQSESEFDDSLVKSPLYNTNIVHVNPEQIPLLRQIFLRRAWDKRYNIAIWLWELEQFPSEWANQFPCFDEIWTPSTFTSASITKNTSLPVITIPYGISAAADGRFDRRYFHLPEDRFLFLCMYDVNSTMERKNPQGAIDAFFSAFPADSSDVGLVVKINNATPNNLSKLSAHIGTHKNVYIMDKLMNKTEVHSLIKVCDVFVSLHRSEGFGLVMAEAMSLGVPVIATNWSANTDFMKPGNSCLVDYRFVDVENQYYKSRQGQRWADPNTDHAAEYMKELFSDKLFYARIAQVAQNDINTNFSIERSARQIIARLHEIGVISCLP